jgi:hypothetical protein
MKPYQVALERIKRAVVAILTESDGQGLDGGTGVLVRVGGREFVFTAGHNIWDKDRGALSEKIALGQLPRTVSSDIKPGDGSAGRVFVAPARPSKYPDPDVAVIETTEKTTLLSDRAPYAEDELGTTSPLRVPHLALAGFPTALVDVGEKVDLGRLGRHTPLDFNLLSMVVPVLVDRVAREEPPKGRGVHVFVPGRVNDPDGSNERVAPHPRGVSGGPLVLPDSNGTLIGLARSREDYPGGDGHDEWCEPVAEAVRLLLEHDSPDVRAAARRVLDRLVATG